MDIDKRFDRILAIFVQLQSRPIVRAQDMADRFQVSLRTIYRDIKSLENAGVPIFSEAGVGYTLMDGYKIPPTLFTKEEALSFAVAEKLMDQYLDSDVSKHFSAALTKMKAVLRQSDKENVAKLENKLIVNRRHHFFNANVPSALAKLFDSIAKQLQLKIAYKSVESDTAKQRLVEPIGVFHESGFWYFMAYCHLRKDIRQFRIDRIEAIEMTSDIFTQTFKPLADYLKKEVKVPKQKVKILVSKRLAYYMSWDKKYYGFISEQETEDGIEMIFETKSLEQEFTRWLLMYADGIKVLEPQALKLSIKNMIDNIKAQLT
ncbi:helix-turn-helix transcriptional regulator [Polluticaenibacter yanchengensis]|uniref:YafY family protein n=1 Tax=Polluticaenibacter yanchengensis TaxID=3014562 RepID=A0ABT4UGF6_9BACT|nr:YafY family protein [Chitinophagaceae bacterium LY-5]